MRLLMQRDPHQEGRGLGIRGDEVDGAGGLVRVWVLPGFLAQAGSSIDGSPHDGFRILDVVGTQPVYGRKRIQRPATLEFACERALRCLACLYGFG